MAISTGCARRLAPSGSIRCSHLFLKELASRPDDIRDHLLAGRLDQATSEAHSLKGAALSVGATPLGNAAFAIETLTSATDIRTSARLIEELELAVAAVRAALAAPKDDSAWRAAAWPDSSRPIFAGFPLAASNPPAITCPLDHGPVGSGGPRGKEREAA